jgi:transposase
MIDKDLIIRLQQLDIRNLKGENSRLQLIIDQKNIRDAQNEIIIGKLQDLIIVLEARVKELENNQKKNSTNSSKPPSTDIARPERTQSLRLKSGKKPGGQLGHDGSTLSFSEKPDAVVIHEVGTCQCCGKNLSEKTIIGYEHRQVFDIPPIQMFVTEHQGQIKCCPGCNTINKAEFPETVCQPVQYGDNVRQLGVYLTQYQLLPFERTAEIFEDLFGHHLSNSFLVNNNRRCAENLQSFITFSKAILRAEDLVYVDESGCNVNGKRYWFHTISTERFSYYAVHTKRGTEAMIDMDVLPFFKGRLMHDFWKSYFEFLCDHLLCNVHHCRDLRFCSEIEKSSWAAKMKELLLALYAKVETAKQTDTTANSLSKAQLQYWYKKYDELNAEGLSTHPLPEKQKGKRGLTKKSKTQNLLQRFINYKDAILAFAGNFTIPFGNNIAEQAIRMVKLKQKISGCFRSEQGAKDFADIRSYIATAKKQGVPVMQALGRAIQGTPLTVMG